MNAGREKTWKRVAVVYLKIFSLDLSMGTEETHEKSQSG
jgi:hypothetical protein